MSGITASPRSMLCVHRVPVAQWAAAVGHDERSASAPRAAAATHGTPVATSPLGALAYGRRAGPHDGIDGVGASVLPLGEASIDAWCASSTHIEQGRHGSLRWCHDEDWFYAALEIEEDASRPGLAAPTERAYRDVFAALRATGFAHLLRVWNYLPRINDHDDGQALERYRQFNVARQKVFLELGQAAFEGAPAACALGTPGGPLCLRLLAGRRAPLPIENPRQVSAYHYPDAYGPRSPSFSRAVLLDAGGERSALLVSGTASIVGHSSRHLGNVAAQARETLRNLQALVASANEQGAARFALDALECTIYVRRPEDAPTVRDVLRDALGAQAPALRSAVYLQGDICRSNLLMEIEAHAFAPGLPHARSRARAAIGATTPVAPEINA